MNGLIVAMSARSDGDEDDNERKIDLQEAAKAIRKTPKREEGNEKIKTWTKTSTRFVG